MAIIDTETGQLVRAPVRAHGGAVHWVAFSDDGSRVVSGADDAAVVLWDSHTGGVTGCITLPVLAPYTPSFLPNSNILIAARGEAAIYEWDPSAERAVEFACRAAGRDLTEAEWSEHFPGQHFRSVCPQN